MADYIISEEWAGKSVKCYLFSCLRLSRAQVVALKKCEDGIVLNGERVFVTALLGNGDRLSLSLDDRSPQEGIVPSEQPVEILYEDDDLLFVDKPPYMPTHPSVNHYGDTLANALAGLFARRGVPFVFRAANRLDRDTSGVVLLSKNKRASALLASLVAGRAVGKRYLALLEGELNEDHGCIDRNILRAEESMILRRTDDLLGEKALSEYSVVARKNGKTLVVAIPHTGRTHQLRVHFAYIGHPIVGDTLYGSADPHIGRQALHALSLSLVHPLTNEPLYVEAPLPDDLAHLLEEYGFEKDTQKIQGFS